jgi:hypothetical protein
MPLFTYHICSFFLKTSSCFFLSGLTPSYIASFSLPATSSRKSSWLSEAKSAKETHLAPCTLLSVLIVQWMGAEFGLLVSALVWNHEGEEYRGFVLHLKGTFKTNL